MKLIDSCKNRGTQSSVKETQHHTARWAGAPAFMRILLQSGIFALPAAGGKKHGRVWENVLVCMKKQQKYVWLTSAMSIPNAAAFVKAIWLWEMICIWSLSTHESLEPGLAFLIDYHLGDAHPNEETNSRCCTWYNPWESQGERDTYCIHTLICSICSICSTINTGRP